MYRARLYSIAQSRRMEWIYHRLEDLLVWLDPLFSRIGYDRLERPFAFTERHLKGFFFDCKMCGQCVLSSTGMSCPMNCPKQLRNGPCGGVRPGGFCEVKPEMRCIWTLAWEGATRMRTGDKIREVLPPIDRRLEGSSAWLRASREKASKLRKADEPEIALAPFVEKATHSTTTGGQP